MAKQACQVLVAIAMSPFDKAAKRIHVKPVDSQGNYAQLPEKHLEWFKSLRDNGSYFAWNAVEKCWSSRHTDAFEGAVNQLKAAVSAMKVPDTEVATEPGKGKQVLPAMPA